MLRPAAISVNQNTSIVYKRCNNYCLIAARSNCGGWQTPESRPDRRQNNERCSVESDSRWTSTALDEIAGITKLNLASKFSVRPLRLAASRLHNPLKLTISLVPKLASANLVEFRFPESSSQPTVAFGCLKQLASQSSSVQSLDPRVWKIIHCTW